MKNALMKSLLYCLIMSLLWGCRNDKRSHMQGYVDAELAYMSSSKGGKLMVFNLDRGDEIKVGDVLFELEEQPEKSMLELGVKKVEESKARLENAEKGQRPTELEALESKVIQAQARYDLAVMMWQRQENLVKQKAIDQATVDRAKREMDESQGLLEETKANLETAKLGARVDEIKAAKAQLEQAEADLVRLQWEYDQKVVKSWVNASIFDKYFEVGENVGAFKPVVSLFVPDKIRAIFFVSEVELNKLKVGQKVRILCDNCRKDIEATISFISPQAEYTPPVIYSTERRSELVFRVEAKFNKEDEMKMNLGMPIEAILIN